MGDFKDINDSIYDRLIERLSEEGYTNIPPEANNKIVDLIGSGLDFEELVIESIKLL